jgi:hypothetical protein
VTGHSSFDNSEPRLYLWVADRDFKGENVANAIHLLIPLNAHSRLIAACDRHAPVREHLVNGIIEKDSSGHDRVRIFCDEVRAQAIFQFVLQTHPDLVRHIDQELFLARTEVQAMRRYASR